MPPRGKGAMGRAEALINGFGDDAMDLEGEKVSPSEIAGVLSELGLSKPKPKPKQAAAPTRPQQPAAPVAPTAPAAGQPPATAFDHVRGRLEEYQRAAVRAKQAGDMTLATQLLRRSKELKTACDAAARALLAAYPPPDVADLTAPPPELSFAQQQPSSRQAPAPAPAPAPAAVPSTAAPEQDELEARLARLAGGSEPSSPAFPSAPPAVPAPAPAPAPPPAPEPEPEAEAAAADGDEAPPPAFNALDPRDVADRALVRAMDSGEWRAIETAVAEHGANASADILGLVRGKGERLRRAAEAAEAAAAAPPAATDAADSGSGGGGTAAAPEAAQQAEEEAAAAEEEEEEDLALVAEEYAKKIDSYNVLEWELEQIGDGELSEALEERKEALEYRKMMLELEVTSGKVEMPAYLARLRVAIEREKGEAKAHKEAGATPLALHAMRRARIMMDELKAAEEGGGGS